MTDIEYENIQAGDVIEIEGWDQRGTATGAYIGMMPEMVWDDKPDQKGMVLSNILQPMAKIVRKGRML